MREAAFDAGDSSLGSSGGESSWLIFHRAHEPRRRLAQAQRLGAADYFEVDLRRGERAELRHDALLWGLPFLSERHGLPRPRLRRLWLAQLTAECRLPGRVYFDFKTNDLPLVEEVVEEARREGLAEGAIASSQHWEVLDRLVKVGPEIPAFYAIPRRGGAEERLGGYLQRAAAAQGGAGASVPRRLAQADTLAAIREAGLRHLIYHVNNYADGVRFMEEGVVGLITRKPQLIEAWRHLLEAGPPAG